MRHRYRIQIKWPQRKEEPRRSRSDRANGLNTNWARPPGDRVTIWGKRLQKNQEDRGVKGETWGKQDMTSLDDRSAPALHWRENPPLCSNPRLWTPYSAWSHQSMSKHTKSARFSKKKKKKRLLCTSDAECSRENTFLKILVHTKIIEK